MPVSAQVVGANGSPPSIMVFAVQVDGEHLRSLLESASSMPEGQRAVVSHLSALLRIVLSPQPTGTGGSGSSDAAEPPAGASSPPGSAPAGNSSPVEATA